MNFLRYSIILLFAFVYAFMIADDYTNIVAEKA
jgi:hypothetical protein